jgi:hypothetical protein
MNEARTPSDQAFSLTLGPRDDAYRSRSTINSVMKVWLRPEHGGLAIEAVEKMLRTVICEGMVGLTVQANIEPGGGTDSLIIDIEALPGARSLPPVSEPEQGILREWEHEKFREVDISYATDRRAVTVRCLLTRYWLI